MANFTRRLGINSHGDTPITSNQPISYGALHHAEYHFDAFSDMWVNPTENANEDVKRAFEDILTPEHAFPPTSSF
ncbi:hypothetical protein J1N35_041145 [Gossypium stocksii]|uniref:Uncharacterized protein n=1 Tax=Gossypium stocksii TaxID=47602 RepID=A0A9D3ZJ09_9ROSI|nr:hypothetical protein J1N35_041145 [Gossypium stocksii]